MPARVEFRGELPYNATGKVLKHEVEADLLEADLLEADPLADGSRPDEGPEP